MQVTMEAVKNLREKTSAGIMNCRDALLETEGDLDKAYQLLRQRGLAEAQERSARSTSQGLVEAYLHPGGRIGVLVELNCETDFVARTDGFKQLAHDLALQVAATAPRYLSAAEVPAGEDLDPQEACLLHQPFIKDESNVIQTLLDEAGAKTGERITVRRFARFEIGSA